MLRLLWIRVSRDETLFELGREGSAEGGAMAEALARFLKDAAKMYEKAFRRKPTWAEIFSTLDFITRLSRREYVIDPRGWDMDEPWMGWVDARGAFSPQETLEAVVEVLRARWTELVPERVTFEHVGMRLSTGEALSPRGGRVDPAVLAEVSAVARAAFGGNRKKPREPRVMAANFASALSRRRERFLGGAECACCVLDLDVKDARRRVRHPHLGTGIVVREDPGRRRAEGAGVLRSGPVGPRGGEDSPRELGHGRRRGAGRGPVGAAEAGPSRALRAARRARVEQGHAPRARGRRHVRLLDGPGGRQRS